MKTAIVPIITNKSGNSSDELNFMYRPSALVTACSEIFESCFWKMLEQYLSYKSGIGIHVWHYNLPLCKLYKCFDLYLLNHHNTIANGVFIRDLCVLRENNIVDDDQDLTSTELTYMIGGLHERMIIY